MAVDPHTGPMICGVMMKTTMPIATGMVELVASMMPKDGILTAQYGTFLSLTFFYKQHDFSIIFYRIVNAKNVHHLDGGVITTVMII